MYHHQEVSSRFRRGAQRNRAVATARRLAPGPRRSAPSRAARGTMSSARAVIKQSVRATALSRPRSVGAAAAAAGAAASPAPPRAAAAAGAAEPSSTVARPQTMTSDMQDMAISIAMEALLKNNSETDVAADIKAAFESNTLTTRARGVARRRGGAVRDAFRPRAGGTASSGATSRATSRTRRRVSRTSTSARSASASSPRTRGGARAPADATSRRLRPPRRDEHGRLPGLWTPPAGSARSDRNHGTRRIM